MFWELPAGPIPIRPSSKRTAAKNGAHPPGRSRRTEEAVSISSCLLLLLPPFPTAFRSNCLSDWAGPEFMHAWLTFENGIQPASSKTDFNFDGPSFLHGDYCLALGPTSRKDDCRLSTATWISSVGRDTRGFTRIFYLLESPMQYLDLSPE